jgi:hypothetical protein
VTARRKLATAARLGEAELDITGEVADLDTGCQWTGIHF